MLKTISQANLPDIKLTVNSFSLSKGNMNITGSVANSGHAESGGFQSLSGAFYGSTGNRRAQQTSGDWFNYLIKDLKLDASRSWTGTTNSVSPQTNALGNGQALDITPSYYTTHMWLRTS